MGVSDRLYTAGEELDATELVIAFGLSLLPAFGLYFMATYIADESMGLVFHLGIVGFTVLLYPKDGWRNKVGSMIFYLAIEAFLFPIGVLIVAIDVITGASGAFAQLGAGIGAGIFFVMTWLVSWIVGVVLYLISGRFETD